MKTGDLCYLPYSTAYSYPTVEEQYVNIMSGDAKLIERGETVVFLESYSPVYAKVLHHRHGVRLIDSVHLQKVT